MVRSRSGNITREELLRNASSKYEPPPDHSSFYFAGAVLITPVLSFVVTGIILALFIPILAPACAKQNFSGLFFIFGSYGALAGLVTHMIWACLTETKMPIIPKLSFSIFGAISATLTVLGDIAEAAIQSGDVNSQLILIVICFIPGLTGGLLALLTKTKAFTFHITSYD